MTWIRMFGLTAALISVLLCAPVLAADKTSSPDGKYVVSVDGSEMFIERLKTHRRIRVGGFLSGCCEFVRDIANKGWDTEVEFRDGAFWTKPGVAWAKGRRFVLVRTADTFWFLSMDGKLQGDV